MTYHQIILKGGRPRMKQMIELFCPTWLNVSAFNAMSGMSIKKKQIVG